MTDNLDFYDCNSSSNSLLKFDITELDIAEEEISESPNTAEVINFEGQMNTMSNNNPLLSTASITIPSRNTSGINSNLISNRMVLSDLSDIVFEFEKSQSPMNNNSNMNNNYNNINNNSFGFKPNQIIINTEDMYQSTSGSGWEYNAMLNPGNLMLTGEEMTEKSGPFEMDEEDIFQVDKSDLIQGPTLAELNGDNLYVDLLNIEDMITNDSPQIIANPFSQGQFTQLTSTNFHNLQNAIMETTSNVEIPQQMFHAINVPQTPHNTPSTSYLSNAGNIIFYEEQPAIYSPPNTVPTSTLTINTLRMNNNSQAGQVAAFSPGSHSSTSTSSVLLNSSLSPPPSLPQTNSFPIASQSLPVQSRSPQSQKSGQVQHNPKFTTLHELLLKKETNTLSPSSPPAQLLSSTSSSLSPVGLSGIGKRLHMSGGSVSSRLSSSAPTHSGLESIWQRREPRQHLLSTGSLAEDPPSSISGILSPDAVDYSQDEAYSDEDSDHYEDFSSGTFHVINPFSLTILNSEFFFSRFR